MYAVASEFHVANSRYDFHSWRRKDLLCLFLLAYCGLTAGCSQQKETLWSSDARSPDGHWLAEARTNDFSGPGTAAVYSVVNLRRTDSSFPPETILAFGENPVELQRPEMKWQSSGELDIVFTREPHLDTQVARYAGVDIVVRVVPTKNVLGPVTRPLAAVSNREGFRGQEQSLYIRDTRSRG